ncbi:peptidoglycan-binding domain-containing protein [Schaalia hyovaginalis]|uniref:Peptidoglycan hydrolase-like protein with peptidoglycan-binding domain n=1 Tax=Schaalia hyovaginalis TaxID=29316 RepID=A0A923E0F3_9ACTO|nr:peptidoglycan-binding protein [Schaalia hyovaginalis]MBB6333628.1 peptidoglycan hydrolase-like protein with peptidoglycan-binding domain [Schaalia hyovaginalis]
MGNLNQLISSMRWWCESGNLGYDQSNRWDVRVGGETDCSALVIAVARSCGFDTGAATYTGNIRRELTARGWVAVTPNGAPEPGDILLADAHHVAVYLGGGLLAQASIDERGRIAGGQAGDQTGYETNVRGYYDYPWDCYLRYTGGQTAAEDWAGTGSAYNPNGYDEEYTRRVQTLLVNAGYSVGPDGILGADTFAAVEAFQRDRGLVVDGIPGPQTLAALQGGSTQVQTAPLVVDAIIGPASIRRLQEVLGTVQDSIISGQYAPNIEYVPAAGDGWEWTSEGEGSAAIAELQRRLGVTDDGILGPDTIRAWQRRLGVTADGYLGSATATMIQRALNEGRLW